MNNADYWKQRMELLERRLLNTGYDYVKNAEWQYKTAIHEVENQVGAWYQRFAQENDISLAEARRLLKGNELAEFKWDVHEYIAKAKENVLSEEWTRQLKNASAKVHISKLQALQIQLQQQIEALYGKQQANLEKALIEIYKEGYYRTAFEIQKGIGVGWAISGVDGKLLSKVLARPWTADGQTFRDRCWTNKQALINNVNNTLTQMLMRGEAPDKAIAAIAKRFDIDKNKAGRLIMTESAAFANVARKDCFNELDVERYVIVEALDSETCSLCADLDGKIFPMSEYAVGLTAPPFHPWCRGTTAPYFADMAGYSERIARDPKTGKQYEVPADMTYKEWKALQKQGDSGIIDLYKGKGIDVLPDGEISEETLKQVSKATKKVTRDFRILEKYSEPIKFGNVNGGWAVNNYDPRTGLNRITLHKIGFSNPDQLLGFLNDDFLSGESYQTNSIYSLVAHEMGHNAHIALALKRSGLEYGNPLSKLESEIFDKNYYKILEDIYEVAFTYESEDEIFSQCAQELGNKAINPKELIAQAFGNYYYGSEKSRIAKKIVKYFKKELK